MTVAVRVGVSVAAAVIVIGRVAVGESATSTSGVGLSVAVGNRVMGVADKAAGWATVATGCGLAELTGTQADSARHTRHKRLRGVRIILSWIISAHYNLTGHHTRQPNFLII